MKNDYQLSYVEEGAREGDGKAKNIIDSSLFPNSLVAHHFFYYPIIFKARALVLSSVINLDWMPAFILSITLVDNDFFFCNYTLQLRHSYSPPCKHRYANPTPIYSFEIDELRHSHSPPCEHRYANHTPIYIQD